MYVMKVGKIYGIFLTVLNASATYTCSRKKMPCYLLD